MQRNINKKKRQRDLLREILTNRRINVGITQTELSLRLDVVHTYVGKIESGERGIDVPEFIEIVRALNLDPIKLFTEFIEYSDQQEKHQPENLNGNKILEESKKIIESLIENNGPDPAQYEQFKKWAYRIKRFLGRFDLTYADLITIRNMFGEILTDLTLWGWTLRSPHDQRGDFELLDKIYLRSISENPKFKKWDECFQATETAAAIRNRKDYLVTLLGELNTAKPSTNILIAGINSGRALLEYFSANSNNLLIDSLESGQKAIDYATDLCRDYLSQVNFYKSNAQRFKPTKKYDLIWAPNLLDEYEDKEAATLINRLLNFLNPDGELVMSSLSPADPSRYQLEILGHWEIIRRSESRLRALLRLLHTSGEITQSTGGDYFIKLKN